VTISSKNELDAGQRFHYETVGFRHHFHLKLSPRAKLINDGSRLAGEFRR